MTYYFIQVILYILAIGAIPVALTKRKVNRKLRLVAGLCPVVLGLLFYLMAKQSSGIFVALMGLWALFFVAIHPNRKPEEKKEDAQ